MGDSWSDTCRLVDVNDRAAGSTRLHAVSAGDGPDVLFLHGYVQSSWCWRHQLHGLSDDFRIHALCAAGFGWSDKPMDASYRVAARAERTLAWMDAVGIERASLVGNSLGGALAVQMAAMAPDRVDKVVLVNPAGPGRYPMLLVSRLMRQQWSLAFMAPAIGAGLWLGLRYAAYSQMPLDDEYMQHFLAPLAADGAVQAAMAAARYYTRDMQAVGDLARDVTHPTLVLRGRHDRIIPARAVDHYRKAIRGAEARIFDHSGHCPHEEEPAAFNDAMRAFLGSHQSRSSRLASGNERRLP